MAGSLSGETYTERSKGKDVRHSNIVAAKVSLVQSEALGVKFSASKVSLCFSLFSFLRQAVAAAIRTSLGPRGMDKLIEKDKEVIITNDGATIMSHMKVLHPAARMLVETSQSQDVRAGDGTTTVVVLAGALLESCEGLLRRGIHATRVSKALREASEFACDSIVKKPVDWRNREALLQAVTTCLDSKVVASSMEDLAPIAVDSVLALVKNSTSDHPMVDLRDVRMVERVGGTLEDTELIEGLVLTQKSQKTAGGPTSVKDGKILLLQYCLSAPKTDMDNTVVVSDYQAMDRILREERKHILGLCKQIKKTGANVVLIQKSILRDAYNELSLHFLAKMGILVVTDIERPDVDFISKTLGCLPVAHADQLDPSKLGQAELVAETHGVVKFTGVQSQNTVTVLLRGSNDLVLQECRRSLHDAQCVVRNLIREPFLVPGGGAPETQAAVKLTQHANTLQGQDAYCYRAFASALEAIPYTLAENAGLNPIGMVTQLRSMHAAGRGGSGINVKKGMVSDMYELGVVQPMMVTTSAIRLATETVGMILKVDDLVVVQ